MKKKKFGQQSAEKYFQLTLVEQWRKEEEEEKEFLFYSCCNAQCNGWQEERLGELSSR